MNRSKSLVLFLSNGGSLTRWQEEGLLSREILLHSEFLRQERFGTIYIFSYDSADQALLAELRKSDPVYERLVVLTPPPGTAVSGVSAGVYSVLGVARHFRTLRRADWFRTNQVSGSWVGVFASLVCRRPLVVRLGYLLSRRFALNGHKVRAVMANMLESVAFRVATRIVVTNTETERYVQSKPAFARKVARLPTYVDAETFREKTSYDFDAPLIYVGRLEPQKNILNLVKACLASDRALDLIGVGTLEAPVRALIATAGPRGDRIRLLGRVPNEILAERLQDYCIFILPSLHEGLPKVLIEAMACGLICIASNIPGVTDLIEDGVNGYLIPTFEIDDIEAQIRRADRERNVAFGHAARVRIQDVFNLPRYVASESVIYSQPLVNRAGTSL